MRHRFYHPNALSTGSTTLEDAEAHHLTHVLRARIGDGVVLFDGQGTEGEARVVEIRRRIVYLEVLATAVTDRECGHPLTLVVALPKGPRQAWLVEKAAELGVHRLIPLRTERGVAQPDDKTLSRLQRTIIESCKQSGRNRLMELGHPLPMAEVVRAVDPTIARWVAHPAAATTTLPAPSAAGVAGWDVEPGEVGHACVAIGPEGGFTDEEVHEAVRTGWRVVSLGPRLLRIETAAVAVAAYWSFLHEAGELPRRHSVHNR